MTDLPTSADYPCRDCGGKGYRTLLLERDNGSYEAVCDLCKGGKRCADRRGLERRVSDRTPSATYAPLVEAVLKTKALLAEYAKAPCFAEFLGDDYGENGCGCPVCALRTIDRILAALPLPEVTP